MVVMHKKSLCLLPFQIPEYLLEIISFYSKLSFFHVIYLLEPSTIKVNYVREILIKLLDKKEIINNFVFVDTQNYGEMTEEETMERLSKNILYCFDLVPKSEEYTTLFIDYPSLAKNSSVVYFHSWKNMDMTSYMGESFKELEIKPDLQSLFSEILIQIFNYTSQVYSNFSHKININLTLSQKNFSDVCEFYSSKYSEYKNVLIEKQKKYNESFEIVEKVKELIEKTNKDIEESSPKRQELDKYIEDQKKILNEKQREKNAWRTKKQNEDKIIAGLNNQKKEKLAGNVAVVKAENGRLVFTDILGISTAVEGTIESIDLMENLIYVQQGERYGA